MTTTEAATTRQLQSIDPFNLRTLETFEEMSRDAVDAATRGSRP